MDSDHTRTDRTGRVLLGLSVFDTEFDTEKGCGRYGRKRWKMEYRRWSLSTSEGLEQNSS